MAQKMKALGRDSAAEGGGGGRRGSSGGGDGPSSGRHSPRVPAPKPLFFKGENVVVIAEVSFVRLHAGTAQLRA